MHPDNVIAVLEGAKPTEADVESLLKRLCGASSFGRGGFEGRLWICFAPTTSIAGSMQVQARVCEVAVKKAYDKKFDVGKIRAVRGWVPLIRPKSDFIAALGATNDSIIYGGSVEIWVDLPAEQLAEWGRHLISASAGEDYGTPFAQIFERYERDFYKIPPEVFTVAQVRLVSLKEDWAQTFGEPILRLVDGLI
jgi:methenyltetrahydromethanopterin cyclohydrolase